MTNRIKPSRKRKGFYNALAVGKLRALDRPPIRAVVNNGRFPFYIMDYSALGYTFKLKQINGKSWDAATRSAFLSFMETVFKIENQEPTIEYTYSFSYVRHPFHGIENKNVDPTKQRTVERINFAKKLSESLELQGSELYISIVASPSKLLSAAKIPLADRIKSVFYEEIKLANEASLIEEIVVEFSDKIRQIISLVAQAGFGVDCPKTEKSLLEMTRESFRPYYHDAQKNAKVTLETELEDKSVSDSSKKSEDTAGKSKSIVGHRPDISLKKELFLSPSAYLYQDLKVDQYKNFWIADGCFNMVFSMMDAPDPNRIFSEFECDKFLTVGVRGGASFIPYFGTFTVGFSSMTIEDGDRKFRTKNALARSFVTDKKGFFENKMASKEARAIDDMHEGYIQGGSDMVRATVQYHIAIPLHYFEKYFDTALPDADLVRFIARNVKQNLEAVGLSVWGVEDRTFYPVWLNSHPGVLRCSSGITKIPIIYLTLEAALHLVPFYATSGPETYGSKDWLGGNYFLTDESTMFVFNHFSKHNGKAANFSICGDTGSGKSVAVQSLLMMTEPLNPNIYIMDFGGGDVGSFTKLCAVMGGIELKFGDPNPPRLNPFQLNEADALPNMRKKAEIAKALKQSESDEKILSMIDSVYAYMRGDTSPYTAESIHQEEIIKRCPLLGGLSYTEIMDIFKLDAGKAKPGEKGIAAIKVILEILLSDNVTNDGPQDNVWATYSLDDINEAIYELYEYYTPKNFGEWPILSDLVEIVKEMQNSRILGTSKFNRYKSKEIYNYSKLLRRLSNFCVGGLDPFIDGQTNVNLMQRRKVGNVEKELPAKFVLADMAGISDKRKTALYMIVVNEFMTRALYGKGDSKGIMVRDEAWMFMGANNRTANAYLEADYRLARKYGFSVVTISQQYSDFKSAVLKNNTQNWIICGLPSEEEVSLASERFKFNDKEKDLFIQGRMGVQIERDVFSGEIKSAYSRFMLANKSGKYFLRNKISPSEIWITTTESDETYVYNFIRNTLMHGKSPIEIIDWLCTGEYRNYEPLKKAIAVAGRRMP